MIELRAHARWWSIVDVVLIAVAPLAAWALAPRERTPPPATSAAESATKVPPPTSEPAAPTSPPTPESHLAEIFGRDSALGRNALVGEEIGRAAGIVDGKLPPGDSIGIASLYRGPVHVCETILDENCVERAVFKREVRHQQREARACIDRARREHPRLRAQIQIDFDVQDDGSVRDPFSSSSVPPGDDDRSPALAELEQCLERAVGRWKLDATWAHSRMSYWYHLRY
jgi:hypothetical protein